jgi:hypothetical protein
MKVAIMQPYFFPYVGYFQLIGAVDLFIVYDNIKYTKKGWINRNRFLRDGEPCTFTLPLRQGSDTLDIRDRWLAEGFERDKLLRQWAGAYRRAPFVDEAMGVLEPVVRCPAANLFDFLHHSIVAVCAALGITTELLVSSGVSADHALKGEARVLSICRATGADLYLNPIGGVKLYEEAHFAERGVTLRFHALRPIRYTQGGSPWVPHLSIVDVLMYSGLEGTRVLLGAFDELAPGAAQGVAAALQGDEA